MKNFITKVDKMNNQLDVVLIQINTGLRLCSLVKEKGKYLELYNPLTVVYGINENGEEFIKLISYQLPMTVESSNTIIRKKDCQVFIPSEMLRSYYLKRVLALSNVTNNQKKSKKKEEVTQKAVIEPESNVIDFTKFRKFKEPEANTSNPDDAA